MPGCPGVVTWFAGLFAGELSSRLVQRPAVPAFSPDSRYSFADIFEGLLMRRTMINALLLSLLVVNPLAAQTENDNQPPMQSGELIWRDPSCYFFVLKIGEHYSLFEFLGGPSPMVGNVFEGKLSAFGTRKIENKTEGKPTMVYSETFDLPKALMDKKIPRQCKRKKDFEAITG